MTCKRDDSARRAMPSQGFFEEGAAQTIAVPFWVLDPWSPRVAGINICTGYMQPHRTSGGSTYTHSRYGLVPKHTRSTKILLRPLLASNHQHPIESCRQILFRFLSFLTLHHPVLSFVPSVVSHLLFFTTSHVGAISSPAAGQPTPPQGQHLNHGQTPSPARHHPIGLLAVAAATLRLGLGTIAPPGLSQLRDIDTLSCPFG